MPDNKSLPTIPTPDEWRSMTQVQQDSWLKTYGEEAGKHGMPVEALIGSSAQLNSLINSYKGGQVSDAITVLQAANSTGEQSKKVVDENATNITTAVQAGQKPAPVTGTAEQQAAAKDQAAGNLATAAGGGTDAKSKARAGIDALTSNVPDWVLAITGGKTPTPEQRSTIIDTYNTLFSSSPLSHSIDDTTLWNTLDKAGSTTFAKALDTNLNQQQFRGKQYTFPTGESFFLSEDRQKAATDRFEANDKTIDQAVALAHALGLSTGGAGPQDTMWQPILAIATALGVTGSALDRALQPGSVDMGFNDVAGVHIKGTPRPGADTGTGAPAAQAPVVFSSTSRVDPGSTIAKTTTAFQSGLGGMSVLDAAKKFQSNLEAYNGDRGLALLATFNKGLADRFLANGRKFLDPKDVTDAAQIFIDSKWGNISDVGLASEKDANVLDAILQGDSSGAFGPGKGAGGRSRTISLPDPEKVKQAADDMWEALFLSKAPAGWAEQQLQAINAKVQGRSATVDPQATGDQTVTDTDPSAQILEALRNSPLYQTLYGNKQAGESEQDYANQFKAAGASMLGNESPDVAALQAGMQSGQYQTTVGAVAGSARSLENSTFMERIARAAQTVNANT